MKIKYGFIAFFLFFTFVTVNAQTGRTVGPLLQTQWHQEEPFNILPDGRRVPWIGCGTIALAQIMKYHNYPVRGRGQSEPYNLRNGNGAQPSVIFNVAYDWNNMLNTYTGIETEQQRNAAAALVYHIAVAWGRDYISGGQGIGDHAANGNRIRTLTEFFGYDNSIQTLFRINYDDVLWEAIIREQLDAGLPVICWGSNLTRTVDHEFVIDGYDNSGRFHINWGWGGDADGWYSLGDLTPRRSIDRGSDFNFNSNNQITINIRPDAGGIEGNAGYGLSLERFTPNKTSVSHNEAFEVIVSVRRIGLQPFPGGQLGIALVNNRGEIVQVIRSVSWDNITGGTGTIRNCIIPATVSAGRYQLRILSRPAGAAEWRIVTVSNAGVPNSIDFTVR
jgi:hypothetical protein